MVEAVAKHHLNQGGKKPRPKTQYPKHQPIIRVSFVSSHQKVRGSSSSHDITKEMEVQSNKVVRTQLSAASPLLVAAQAELLLQLKEWVGDWLIIERIVLEILIGEFLVIQVRKWILSLNGWGLHT